MAESNISLNPSTVYLGMDMDSVAPQIAAGKYPYALNSVVGNFDGNSFTLQNEQGNILCTSFPAGWKLVGKLNILEQNRVVVWLVKEDETDSQIGVVDINTCEYTKKAQASCLNLRKQYPILQAVYKLTNCTTEVYWTDAFNIRRWIDLENIPYKEELNSDTCSTVYTDEIDCNKMAVQPNFTIPQITPTKIENDGENTAGTYQFAIQYSNAISEPYTAFYSVTNPISLFDPLKVTPDFNYPVNQSIQVDITNIDTTGFFEYFNVAVIKTINNITTPYLVGTYKINGSTHRLSYTGQNKQLINLSIQDIFQKYPHWDIADGVATSDDTLIWYGVTTSERLIYQTIWNNVHLNWETWRVKGDKYYQNGLHTSTRKGYFRDEVYPVEGVFLLKNGEQTDRCIINSRVATDYDRELIYNRDVPEDLSICDNNPVPKPRWQIYNTANILGQYPDVEDPCYEGPYQYGEFAYWESEETYPCNRELWGNLANQPIRHHKFPDSSITHIHDSEGYIYPIGIKIDVQEVMEAIRTSNLTQQQKDNIVGFKIVRGNRATNKSIIARGLINNVGQYTKDETTYFFPNYPYNDLREDPFITGTEFTENSKTRYTFHSPDTSFYQPYLGNILKLETVEYGKSTGHFVQVKGHAKYKLYSPNIYTAAFGTFGSILLVTAITRPGINYTAAITAYQTIVDILQRIAPRINPVYQYNSIGNYTDFKPISNLGNKQRLLDIATYAIPGMLAVGDTYRLNNWERESSIYLRSTYELPLPGSYPGVPEDNSRWNGCQPINQREETNINGYYATVKNIVNNQWGQIYSYESVDTGFQVLLDLNTNLHNNRYQTVFGGDCFINQFSYKTKLPYFIDNRVNAQDDSDIFYNELFNIGDVKYWFSTDSKANSGTFQIIYGVPTVHMQCENTTFLVQKGRMYLASYGIPTFYCESEVNVDMRQAYNGKEGDFFPHVGTDIPDDWLQEINVPIAFDNTYTYNKTFSKQNKENYFSFIPENFTQDICQRVFDNRAIYSDQQRNFVDGTSNKWLLYKPVSFFDFPSKVVSLDGIANKAILARFENKTMYYNGLLTVQTSNPQAAYLGNNSLFNSAPPIDFSDTDLGYAGSQNKFLLKIPEGNITVDAKRGDVFILRDTKLEEISNKGVSKFLTEYLSFSILKYFPTVNTDNHFNGCGIHGVYDAKYNRVILTKLDYIPLSPKISYTDGKFYLEKEITKIVTTPAVCCPLGFNEQGGVCVKQVKVPATRTSDVSFVAEQRNEASCRGSVGASIYSTFSQDGTGTYTNLPLINFWKNPSCAASTTAAPINRVGFWNASGSAPLFTWVGVTLPINIPTTKTYYIGIGADDLFRIKLNCDLIVESDIPAMAINHGIPGGALSGVGFKVWHIYPVTIEAGLNELTIEAFNINTFGLLGCEIYDNTPEEILAATSYEDLNVIFTTASLFGQEVEAFNYTCSEGCNSVVQEGDEYFCYERLELPLNCQPPVQTVVKSKEYEEVQLTDPLYFCNNSLTISYSFTTESWISLHSYLPNYYVGSNNFFYSGLNNGTPQFWKHSSSETLFNNFYGKIEPYIIEYSYAYKNQDEILQNIKDYSKILEYTDYQSFIETDDYYFNKAVLYNNQQCSGTLLLTKKPSNNLAILSTFPKYNSDSKEILFTKSDSYYNFNTFWSLNKTSKEPIWLKSCESLSIFKELNQGNMNYSKRAYTKSPLRSKELRVRLINDAKDNLKFISSWILSPTMKSYK